MKILITGVCGFVGTRLAEWFARHRSDWGIYGIDNLSRGGAELNRNKLKHLGVQFFHADLRCRSDLQGLPAVDWVIDAAALPSVLAGTGAEGASLQLMENNLFGTIFLLEYCRSRNAGLILLSTSRVYEITALAGLPLDEVDGEFVPRWNEIQLPGFSELGLSEAFSTSPPLSLYGSSKLASEVLAQEYSLTFDFPLRINRCGVMAGAGQFGQATQGIFAYWIHSHQQRQPLKYLGFNGSGAQVRDMLHPEDLANLISQQLAAGDSEASPVILNVAGGIESAISLRQLTEWCDERFGPHPVASHLQPRPFDLPWLVLDSTLAREVWNWSPSWTRSMILEEIATFAEFHPEWLERSR